MLPRMKATGAQAPAKAKSAAATEDPLAVAAAAGLRGVRGQPRVVEVLRSALVAGRPHHAYLFDGPAGTGKATTARALMAALNCQAPPAVGDACGECESCLKLSTGSHPDLILVDMTLAGLADEIEKLVRRLQFPPFEGQVQLVLVDPADAFAAPTAQTAANRLLKTLEEPRPRTHFVLVTTAATALLSTIRSRCQRLRFAPLPDADLQQVLIDAHAVPSELAASVSKLAQGSLGRALQFVQDQDGLAKRQQAAQELYQAAKDGRVGAMVSVASDAGADREEAIETLDLLWLRLHEELMAAVARAGSGSGTRDPQVLRLLGAVQAVRDAQQAIRRYTSAPLSLERLQRQLHPSLLGAAHGPGSHR